MSLPAIFLDVNIPMYAVGKEHPYKAPCAWVMRRVGEGRLAVAIDTEVLQEIMYRYGAINEAQGGASMSRRVLRIVPTVYAVTVPDIWRAIALFEKHASQGVAARDTIHAAVMHSNGLTHILSADQHFDRIEGITRIAVTSLEQVQADLDHFRVEP